MGTTLSDSKHNGSPFYGCRVNEGLLDILEPQSFLNGFFQVKFCVTIFTLKKAELSFLQLIFRIVVSGESKKMEEALQEAGVQGATGEESVSSREQPVKALQPPRRKSILKPAAPLGRPYLSSGIQILNIQTNAISYKLHSN